MVGPRRAAVAAALVVVAAGLLAHAVRGSAPSRCQTSPFDGNTDIGPLVALGGVQPSLYAERPGRWLDVSGDGVKWDRRRVRVPGFLVGSGRAGVLYSDGSTGLYRSVDWGRSWRPLPKTCGWVVRQFVIAPSDPRVWYLAAAAIETSVHGAGLYVSHDAGRTWARRGGFRYGSHGNPGPMALAVDPMDASRVVIGSDTGGLQLSADGGKSWRLTAIRPVSDVGADGVYITVLRFGPHGRIWAESHQGVYDALPPYQHWRFDSRVWPTDLLPDPKVANVIYLTYDSVLRSGDGGRHWEHVRAGSGPLDGVAIGADGTIAYGWQGAKVFSSRDHGATWRLLGSVPDFTK